MKENKQICDGECNHDFCEGKRPDKENKQIEECNCQSSNRPDIGTTPARVLDPNKYFKWDAPAKKVSVDECIADEVIALWEEKIWTKGSCCGHNDFWSRSIILEESVLGVELEKAKRLVSPNTKLEQWRLVDVSESPISIRQQTAREIYDDLEGIKGKEYYSDRGFHEMTAKNKALTAGQQKIKEKYLSDKE